MLRGAMQRLGHWPTRSPVINSPHQFRREKTSIALERERERRAGPSNSLTWLPPTLSFFWFPHVERAAPFGAVGFLFLFFFGFWFYRYIEEMKPSQTLFLTKCGRNLVSITHFHLFCPFLSTSFGSVLTAYQTFFWDPPTRVLSMFTLLRKNLKIGI